MSAIEIIEQIKKLPGRERKKVMEWVRQADVSGAAPQGEAASVSEDFKRIADEVFNDHADLFRKLAQ